MAQNEKSGSDLDIFEGSGKRRPTVPPPNGARSVPPPPASRGRAPTHGWQAHALGVTAPTAMPMPTAAVALARRLRRAAARCRRSSSAAHRPHVERPAASACVRAPGPRTPERRAPPSTWTGTRRTRRRTSSTSERVDDIFDDEANQATKIGDPSPRSQRLPPSAPSPRPRPPCSGSPRRRPHRIRRAAVATATGRRGPRLRRLGARAVGRRPVGLPGLRPAFPAAANDQPVPARARPPRRASGTSPHSRTMPPSGPPAYQPMPHAADSPPRPGARTTCPARVARWKRPRWSARRRTARCSWSPSASRASSRSGRRVFLLMPHTGRIVINVTDAKSGAVNRVDIFVDGRKTPCDTAPCIVDQVSAGTHEVKVLADGYDAPAVADGERRVAQGRDGDVHARLRRRQRHQGRRRAARREALRRRQGDRPAAAGGPRPHAGRSHHQASPARSATSRSRSTSRVEQGQRAGPRDDHAQGPQGQGDDQPRHAGRARVPRERRRPARAADAAHLGRHRHGQDLVARRPAKPGYSDYNQPITFDDGQAEKSYTVSLDPRAPARRRRRRLRSPRRCTAPAAGARRPPRPRRPQRRRPQRPAPARRRGVPQHQLDPALHLLPRRHARSAARPRCTSRSSRARTP